MPAQKSVLAFGDAAHLCRQSRQLNCLHRLHNHGSRTRPNAGPLLSTAAIILLGCSIFSAARQMNKGGRKTVGPDDNLQSESQLLSEAQLDQVDRQNIEAPSLRQSPTVPMLAWGREGTAQLLFSRKAQEASQSEVPQLSAYEIFQLQWSYYSFLRRSQALKGGVQVLKSQERQSPPILVRLEKSSTSAGGELEIYGATDPTHLGAQVSLLPKPIRQP